MNEGTSGSTQHLGGNSIPDDIGREKRLVFSATMISIRLGEERIFAPPVWSGRETMDELIASTMRILAQHEPAADHQHRFATNSSREDVWREFGQQQRLRDPPRHEIPLQIYGV